MKGSSIVPENEDVILIDHLLSELNCYWNEKKFNIIRKDKYDDKILKIKGAFIVKISDKNKDKISVCIENLKNHHIINQKYLQIKSNYMDIIYKANALSTDIRKKLVNI